MKFMKQTSYWKLHQMCYGYYASHIYYLNRQPELISIRV